MFIHLDKPRSCGWRWTEGWKDGKGWRTAAAVRETLPAPPVLFPVQQLKYVYLYQRFFSTMHFVFCHLYPFFPQPTRQCLGPDISLLINSTVSPVRACLIVWWERFRGTQKEDDRGPHSIQSSLNRTIDSRIKRDRFRQGEYPLLKRNF